MPHRRASGQLRIGPIVEMRVEVEEHQPALSLYDPAELDEPVELDLPRKRKILDTFYGLDSLTHYELLGVPPEADKKALKAAYFELVNVFHPDRYYGKNLGSFKGKLERIFARITEAHDVLTRQPGRADYDTYLASQQRTRALDQTLRDMQSSAREAARIEREIAEQARAVERSHHSYPPPAADGTPPITDRPASGSSPIPRVYGSSLPPARLSGAPAGVPSGAPTPTPSQRPMDPEARRRALARKLGVSMPPAARAPVESTPVSSPVSSREAAADDLRRRYEQRVLELKRRQIEHYVHAAETAFAAKDLISASNALKIAVSLAPGDAALAARFEDLQAQATTILAASYLEQAQYEEREGRYADAARSYERLARGKSNPKIFDRVAYCMMSAKGDLKVAADWAKKAVQASPDDASYRVTLARIYLEGGLRQSAVAEFERAATLAPKDDSIKDWLKRAKRTDA
jgi:curved DNA-binding protein CbpA